MILFVDNNSGILFIKKIFYGLEYKRLKSAVTRILKLESKCQR